MLINVTTIGGVRAIDTDVTTVKWFGVQYRLAKPDRSLPVAQRLIPAGSLALIIAVTAQPGLAENDYTHADNVLRIIFHNDVVAYRIDDRATIEADVLALLAAGIPQRPLHSNMKGSIP